MANDYLSLAQLSRPQMRGNAPIGGGGGAGADYYQQQNQHQQFLAQATQQAQRQAEAQAADAEEKALGAPGRRATIKSGNALAEGNLALTPQLLDNQRKKVMGEGGKLDQEELGRQLKILDEFAQEYVQAKDEEGKKEVITRMKAAGLEKLGPQSVDELYTSGRLDAAMERRFNKLVNSPSHLQKRQIEKDKAEAGIRKEEVRIKSIQTS